MRMNKDNDGAMLLFWVSRDEAISISRPFRLGLYYLVKPEVEVGVHHPCDLNLCDLTFNSLYVHF